MSYPTADLGRPSHSTSPARAGAGLHTDPAPGPASGAPAGPDLLGLVAFISSTRPSSADAPTRGPGRSLWRGFDPAIADRAAREAHAAWVAERPPGSRGDPGPPDPARALTNL